MSTIQGPSGLSPYLYRLESNKYGGHQDDYLKRAEEAIKWVKNEVESLKATKRLSEFSFLDIQQRLAEIRGEIAKSHQTENAEAFGAPRIFQEGKPHPEVYTNLITPVGGRAYSQDGLRLIQELQPKIKQMKYTVENFPDNQTIESTETVLDRNFSTKLEVFSSTVLNQKNWLTIVSKEELNDALKVDMEPIDIIKNKDLMLALKKSHPHLYERLNSHCMIHAMNRLYPGPRHGGPEVRMKSLYTRVTLRCEINKKMYAIGKVFSWMYQTKQNDPVDRMDQPCDLAGSKSIPFIEHQDPFLIEDTMKELGKMFLDILSWDKEKNSLEELQQKIALFRYVYGFCAPCRRGDGAIGDWLEIALYRFHGFQNTRHNPECLPCFELFSLSFSDYLKRYPSTIIVE